MNFLLFHVRNLLSLVTLRCKINYAFNLEPLSSYHSCNVQCFTTIPFLALGNEILGLCASPSLPLRTHMGQFSKHCFYCFVLKYWAIGIVKMLTDANVHQYHQNLIQLNHTANNSLSLYCLFFGQILL